MIDRATGKLELIAGDGKAGDGPESRLEEVQNGSSTRDIDTDGAIYIGDTNTHRIRVIRPRSQ